MDYLVEKVKVMVEVKRGRKRLFEVAFEYPIRVASFLNTVIYDVADPSYESEVDVFQFFEGIDNCDDCVFASRVDGINYSSSTISGCIRGAIGKYILKRLIGLERYAWKCIGGSWGFDVYRLKRNPMVSMIVSEASDTYIVTRTGDEEEHNAILSRLTEECLAADIAFSLLTSGILAKCPKCKSETTITIKRNACPYCNTNLLAQLSESLWIMSSPALRGVSR